MSILDIALHAALAALTAAAPLALYLFCVRPALRWLRARLTAHVAVAAAGLAPALVVIIGMDSRTAGFVAAAATVGVMIAWFYPSALVHLTGGPAIATGELDVMLGYLFPAGRSLDVGDLEAARVQVDEARRYATPATASYVDLWDELVREEHDRRIGRRISRVERLEAIQAEYSRLVRLTDRLPTALSLALTVLVAAVAASSVVAGR